MEHRRVNKNRERRKEILAEVKAKFSAVIGDEAGKVPVHVAAEKLNVSRQMIHRYIKGETIPRADLLVAAMHEWKDLVITYRGVDLTSGHRERTRTNAEVEPKQLPLFRLAEELSNRDVEVKIKNVSVQGIELEVNIRFTA